MKLLYVREEVTQQLHFLDKPARKKVVQGPPGCGKSCVAWAWSCMQARGGTNVLWAHLRKGGVAEVALLESNTVTAVGTVKIPTLEDIIHRSKVSIIVLDGVVLQTEGNLLGAAESWASTRAGGRSLVHVNSESVTIPGEELSATNTIEHRVLSWTFEQYEACLKLPQFVKQVAECVGNEDDSLANKFFLGGGCVRWVLGMPAEVAIIDIDKHIERIENKEALLSGMQGAKAKGHVNHMVQRVARGTFLVSEYVTRSLADSCEKRFVAQAFVQSVKLENPSFDGWVLEMDFMMQLRLAQLNTAAIEVTIGDESKEDWKVPKRIAFRDPNDLVGNVIPQSVPEAKENLLGVTDGAWLVPKRWNQGGYDAAQILATSVRFVQVTRGSTHSLKLQYMRALIDALVAINRRIESVDVVFVVPVGDCKKFNLSSVRVVSDLRAWGWKLENARVGGITRTRPYE